MSKWFLFAYRPRAQWLVRPMPRQGVSKEQRGFTDAEVGKILSAASEPFGTILAVAAVLALRIGESSPFVSVTLTSGERLSVSDKALASPLGQFKW